MVIYHQGIITFCFISTLLSTVRADNPRSNVAHNESCSYPQCGCSAIIHHDLMSPWHTYERPHFPWLVRVMQDGEFKSAGSLISDKWIISSPLMLIGTKGIEVVVDTNLAQKIHRLVVKLLIHPSATYKVCRFCIMKMNESIDFKLYKGQVGPVCLPPNKSHFYNRVQLTSFIAPAGYNTISGSYYRLRHLTLDCCHHEMEKCEIDGITCSSDLCPEWDTLGCKGAIGAPIIARLGGGQFYIISVMCDILGCERQSPCAMFPMVSHHYDFIRRAINRN